ncbi:hypothetical protein MICCA_90031 [Microcystis aeruginosa PCC 9432]|uniref:Uncharacterized protein n=2 Tax=Microcystis aeruginosa TaxID=1126 RepID=I4IS14_MICAE|nr:hypothetical protein MICCA_90031 [Microcystis aeruginosa PCC 9432]CCI37088.1 hypothetical protein MICAK_3010002 [Microcystis aeruginosa PCC 9701]
MQIVGLQIVRHSIFRCIQQPQPAGLILESTGSKNCTAKTDCDPS